jgi:drug/metabolite transporter (DMT)-like permease
MTARLIFNILAVCGAATFTGVMLNIGLTLGAYWKGLPPSEFLDWFSANNHLIARTIPLVALPTLIGLAGSLWFGWSEPTTRYQWLASLCLVIGILIITFAYRNADDAASVRPLQIAPVDRYGVGGAAYGTDGYRL